MCLYSCRSAANGLRRVAAREGTSFVLKVQSAHGRGSVWR